MTKKSENSGFVCINCGAGVLRLAGGSYRNHCPFCLHSRHVDVEPGDRASDCGGLMRPVGTKLSRKGPQVLHRCDACGFERLNIINDDPVQPDNYELFLEIMQNT